MTYGLPEPVEPVGIERVALTLSVLLDDGRTATYEFPNLVPDADALRVTGDNHTHVSVDVQRSLPEGGTRFAPAWRPQRQAEVPDFDLVTIALRGLRAVPVDEHLDVDLSKPGYTMRIEP